MGYMKRDLEFGKMAERRAMDVFGRAPSVGCLPNKKKDLAGMAGWDFAFSFDGEGVSVPRYVEVKFDRYEAHSGNVAVEYYNPRSAKPSGLGATESHVWVFVLADHSVWACSTEDLRRYFASSKGVRDVHGGGDGNATFRLFRRDDLFDRLFVRLDELPPEELTDALLALSSTYFEGDDER